MSSEIDLIYTRLRDTLQQISLPEADIRTYLETQRRMEKQLKEEMPVVLRSAASFEDAFRREQQRTISQLIEAQRILAQALQPLPDIVKQFRLEVPHLEAAAREALIGLNRAIANGSLIAEFVVEKEVVGGTPNGNTPVGLIEPTNDSLALLKEVDFLPLTMLDQVLRDPTSMRALSARNFEQFIATLIDRLGFEDVIITPQSGDLGRDILATKRIHGISIVFAFECKRYREDCPVGPDIMRALLGTVLHGNSRATKGVLVTTSTFTPAARKFIVTEPALDGRDFEGILEWLRECSSAMRRRSA